ncbi:hypothetical protein SAMN02745164_00261 [Marinitoga hydrogenitolerans DSM 16785]|uniref:Lipocalin-like domain-containing protein n=1 Tax=Marinitoga hydrogenitolerans (strain DSM 16785 / JCM 12826 / AT1271) TaxID=1122195 RepID=A0A1M4SQ07_MARH1|nr:hypothetical protein [Marinitoga hydrogenitolerans]SHE34333.1 hypothetical protein SAMN02745164_00261 [Marinitoga hydrogenitolerans DSM 16785]
MKRVFLLLFIFSIVVGLTSCVVFKSPPDIRGTWESIVKNGDYTTTLQIKIKTQNGENFSGEYYESSSLGTYTLFFSNGKIDNEGNFSFKIEEESNGSTMALSISGKVNGNTMSATMIITIDGEKYGELSLSFSKK